MIRDVCIRRITSTYFLGVLAIAINNYATIDLKSIAFNLETIEDPIDFELREDSFKTDLTCNS